MLGRHPRSPHWSNNELMVSPCFTTRCALKERDPFAEPVWARLDIDSLILILILILVLTLILIFPASRRARPMTSFLYLPFFLLFWRLRCLNAPVSFRTICHWRGCSRASLYFQPCTQTGFFIIMRWTNCINTVAGRIDSLQLWAKHVIVFI